MERLHPTGQRQGRRLQRAHRCAARRRGGAQSPHGRPGRPHSRHQDWRQARARGAAATLQLLDEVPVGSDLYYQQKGTIFPTASFHSRPPPFQYLEIFPLRKRKCQSCAAAWGETRATTIYPPRFCPHPCTAHVPGQAMVGASPN